MGVHSMLDVVLSLASLGAVVAVALLGRRFIGIDDAERSVMTDEDGDRGWVPSRADAQLLEQTRLGIDLGTQVPRAGR
jgi:hypothetical protein